MHESFIPMPIAIHSNSNENAKIISIPQANAIYNQSFQFLFPLAADFTWNIPMYHEHKRV